MEDSEYMEDSTGLKKAALLYILEILKSKSASCVGMDQSDIIEIMKEEYGITLNRETVGRNLDILLSVYPDNITYRLNNAQKRCGWRWVEGSNDDFDASEVRLLLGVIECYGKLDSRHKQDLMIRVARLNGDVQAKTVSAQFDEARKRDATYRLFYNIGTLGEAIAKGVKITYSKGIYTKDGDIIRAEGENARSYLVRPASIAFKNNTYMLISTYGDDDNPRVMHSIIDTMFDVAIDPDSSKAPQSQHVTLDIQKYLDEHLYMYSQDPQRTVIRIFNNPTCIRQMYEQFGLGVKSTKPCENDDYIDFVVFEPEMPMVFWALQYSDMAEVLEPESLREKIAEQAMILKEKYCSG